MPRTARIASESDFYHVFNRGSGQQIIFESDDDRAYFLARTANSIHEEDGKLYAWCLMDNHFHLVVKIELEHLSSAMHAIQSAYAGYFNRVHGHTGAVFSSRFKSEPITTDKYLMAAVRYVHNNPVKAGICAKPAEYPWSSFNEYIKCATITDTTFIIDMFGSEQAFETSHESNSDIELFDINAQSSILVSDKEAINIAAKALGEDGAEKVKSLNKDLRNAAIMKLRRCGLGVRQIQRLTGVPLSVISRTTNK